MPEIKNRITSITNAIKTSPTVIIFLVLLSIGTVLRVWDFPNTPYGLHQDEMNAGYEAWSLLNFGVDHWGNNWPVYFPSWGSGQNVLYSYYLIPFMALFGPTDFTVRLGMLIAGILVPVLVFFLAKLWFNRNVALIAMGISSIFPDLIRSSRWAVESNFASFASVAGLLLFSYVLLKKNNNRFLILISLIPLALAPYTYVITAVPVGLTVVITLWWKRELIKARLKYWVVSFILFCLVLLPLVLFAAKTTVLDNKPYFFEKWLPFSIPPLTASRYEEIAGGSDPNVLNIMYDNIIQLLPGFYQSQIGGGFDFSQIPFILVIIAIWVSFFSKTKQFLPFSIIHIWLMASIPLILTVPLSNTRGNFLYVPSIILVSALLFYLFTVVAKNKPLIRKTMISVGAVYAIFVSFWFHDYLTNPALYFYKDLNVAFEKVEETNVYKKPVLLDETDNYIALPYLQAAWFAKIPPAEIEQYKNPENHLSNYYFDSKLLNKNTEYYEIIRDGYTAGCTDGKTVYKGVAWNVYECPALNETQQKTSK